MKFIILNPKSNNLIYILKQNKNNFIKIIKEF